MKIKIKFYLVFIMLVFILSVNSCQKKFSGEWVAKIDGDIITIDELNTFYYAQHKSLYNITKEEIDKLASDSSSVEKNPTLNKKEFLEQLVRQRLVYNKAVSEGVMKDSEVAALVQIAKEAVVVGSYVRQKFKDDIEISDEEIEKLYSKQRKKFKGVPIEQAELYIKQQIVQQKLQGKIRELVENLREERRIERNDSLLK